MSYLNLPNQHLDPSIRYNILYRDRQLWFQRITQIEVDKFLFLNVPLDTVNFTGAVRKALFPNQPNTCVHGNERPECTKSIAESYIIDTSDPPRMDPLPDEEASIYMWIHDDCSLEILIYIEDEDLNYVMGQDILLNVQKFIDEIADDLKRQAMFLANNADSEPCVNQIVGMPFECCSKCPVCHCG